MTDKPLKILPTNDLLFQHLFGKVGNEEITKDFLEKLLNIKIEGLTLDVNKRMQGEWLDDKIGRLDVKAKLSDGTTVTIEMQVSYYMEMAKRILCYWSETYLEGIKRSEDYEDLHRTISILITVENMPFTQEIEKYHSIWNLREKDHPNVKFSDDMEIHLIELKKFDNRKEESPEDNWIKFINCKKEGEMEELDVDEKIQKAIEEFNRLVDDPENHDEYIFRRNALRDQISFLSSAKRARDKGLAEGRAEGLETGRAEGLKKGKIEGKIEGLKAGKNEAQIEIAKKLIAKNMNIDDIIEITRINQRRNYKIKNLK